DFSMYYLEKFLKEKGWQYLNRGDSGDPSSNAGIQNGDIDGDGHEKQLKLATRIDILLAEIVETVGELLDVGWQKIRIVTDHGWLLTPTPMAKVELPKHLTETRWGRCAVIKDSMDSGYQQVGWFWNNAVSIAMAPGASSFIAGRYYDHGGLSLQECLTPVIAVRKNPSLVTNVTASATLSAFR